MKQFLIKYRLKNVTPEAWHQDVTAFIAAITPETWQPRRHPEYRAGPGGYCARQGEVVPQPLPGLSCCFASPSAIGSGAAGLPRCYRPTWVVGFHGHTIPGSKGWSLALLWTPAAHSGAARAEGVRPWGHRSPQSSSLQRALRPCSLRPLVVRSARTEGRIPDARRGRNGRTTLIRAMPTIVPWCGRRILAAPSSPKHGRGPFCSELPASS